MAKYMMKLAEVKKLSKPSLVMKIMRDSTQIQKNKMLKLVLKRMPKAMLVRLCVMVAKKNLPKLKLTNKKGDMSMTKRKAYIEASPWKKGSTRDKQRTKLYDLANKRKSKTKRTGKPKNAKVGDRFRAKNGRMMKVVKGGKVQFV